MFLFFNKSMKSNKELSKTNILKSEGYIILDHISNGSYGEVRHAKYIQEDKELNLVVKIIDTRQTSKEYVSKFLPRELDVIRQINHPYIIYTHSILQKKAVLFVFMAFAERGDLLQYIIDHGALKEKLARVWFRQVALAVQYLHTLEIVHRDIKCENILITEHYTVKLTDFGFSKFVSSKRLNCSTYCCSLGYAPPEILTTRPYDGKTSDIWSLGVVLYVMLNKKMPFNRKNMKLMYKQQVKRDWEHQPSVESIISENLKMCIDNILQPEPRKRWTIDKILNSDWIKMNRRLVNMTDQESFALVEALNQDKTINQKHLKKIKANRSDTQQILSKRSPRFLSIAQQLESISSSNREKDGSKYMLKRSQRMVHTNNILDTKNDLTKN
ncbi:testis-specific serine/threonine-protein kinase 2-like [Myzus persicae]|uniref:testis-specific serine/threonine-protein kinase 2-like n=1 Tax=Myzus persicae TaxID=13164 RepID=UPI000B931251|nr:testis-specific serine/threonine-protein kinase 2-like [Myzus persicae]